MYRSEPWDSRPSAFVRQRRPLGQKACSRRRDWPRMSPAQTSGLFLSSGSPVPGAVGLSQISLGPIDDLRRGDLRKALKEKSAEEVPGAFQEFPMRRLLAAPLPCIAGQAGNACTEEDQRRRFRNSHGCCCRMGEQEHRTETQDNYNKVTHLSSSFEN